MKTEDLLWKLKTVALFSYGKVKDKDVLFNQGHISLGRAKGRGKRGYGGESINEVIFPKFPLLSKIQSLSQKLLVKILTTTIAINMPNNLYAGIFK